MKPCNVEISHLAHARYAVPVPIDLTSPAGPMAHAMPNIDDLLPFATIIARQKGPNPWSGVPAP